MPTWLKEVHRYITLGTFPSSDVRHHIGYIFDKCQNLLTSLHLNFEFEKSFKIWKEKIRVVHLAMTFVKMTMCTLVSINGKLLLSFWWAGKVL